METRNIFVDTEAFYRENLRFDGPVLSQLATLGQANALNILYTPIVYQEVLSHNKIMSLELKNSISSMMRMTHYLHNDVPANLLSIANESLETDFEKIGKARFDNFLHQANATLLPINAISAQELADLYFLGRPPFGHKKKKNEFPDAISLVGLHQWADTNKQSVFVVSHDKDMKGFCDEIENLISLDHLTEVLDLYNRATKPMAETVHVYLHRNHEVAVESIGQIFSDFSFSYEDLAESYADNISVESGEITEIDVVEIDDESAVVAITLNLKFTADVYGEDMSNAIWDKEDGHYYNVEYFTENLSFEKTFVSTVDLVIQTDDEPDTEPEIIIDRVTFNDDYEIALNSDDIRV